METIIQAYGLTIVLVVAVGLILVIYRYFLGDRYTQAANKLKSQMANIRRDFPELNANNRKLVGKSLNELGIEGIMEELGIDPNIIQSPFIKGLFDKYAPRLLEQLSQKTSTGEKPETGEKWI